MNNLDGDGNVATVLPVEQSAMCFSPGDLNRGFFQSRLKSLALLLVTLAGVTLALAWVCLDVLGGAKDGNAVGHTSRVATVVPRVESEGFHGRRRAMAGVVSRHRAFAGEKPTGFVFEAATMEREKSLRAADLLAAAGARVLVLDGAADVKDSIHRCIQRDGCDSANAIAEIRARFAEVVRNSLAPPSPRSDTGYSMSSGVPADDVIGDETLDHLFVRTYGGETGMQAESGAARECNGELDSERRAGMVEEAQYPLAAASAGTAEESVEGGVDAEARNSGTSGGEDVPEYAERSSAWCDTDGWGADAGAGSVGLEEEAGGLGLRVGGTGRDGISIGRVVPSEEGVMSDAEETAVVVALSGWNADEIEALLQAYPGTPWLYLFYDGHDGSASSCQQNLSAVTATRLLSSYAESSEGVVLPSSNLTAAAAARALTRLFRVKLSPIGELRMAELYASHTLAETEPSSDVLAEATTADGVGAPWSCPSEGRAHTSEEACRDLWEASTNSAKVLGGRFDTAWWWGLEEKLESKTFGSVAGGAPARSESSTRVLATDADADAGASDAGASGASVAFGKEWPSHEAVADGDDGRSSGSGWRQGQAGDGGAADNFPVAAGEARRGPDPLELGALAASPEGGQGVDREDARRWWQRQRRGLRRMVDGESPSWMSSEVYSEPLESFPCPDVPGPDYPSEWPLLDLLENWNPRNASAVPPRHFLGVCRFDYLTELHKARAYALSEVPFVVNNVPELDRAVQEWSDPVKLAAALENHLYSIDVSSTNRFLYYGKRSLDRPPGWRPPTWRVTDTFGAWLQCALGACEHMDHSLAEYDLSDEHADSSGMASDQSLDFYLHQSPDPSLEGLRPDESAGIGETFASEVGNEEGGETASTMPPGRKLHYYLKFSSTREKPNRFVNRSLPFFVPPASSRETVDNDHDASPADGEYTAGKRGRRRKRSRTSRWTLKEAWDEDRREHLAERFDGETVKSAGVGGGVKQQQPEEEHDGGDSINIFLRDASATKGIHCRLGMDGVMSDGHYDGSRNMVALLAGKRRWILSNPKNCGHMHMFRKGHPSARHTSADWTDPEVATHSPDLAKATANEVVLRAGEALYVPEHWIHSIVNIGVSAQCNSRSGKSYLYHSIVQECEASASAE
eukprot:g13972.t1